mmetsp:Transcript_22023/g.37294  ORF Transcript_22023/g.37294 Transcript_22023/m.37294 type:complete len:184 (+) Transcript_22023:100-651(+)
MAFFGLTALGQQNTFHASSILATNLHVFVEKDFESAWNRVTGSAASCEGAQLSEVFIKLYHGPVPEHDAERLSEAFEGGIMDVTFEKYMDTMMFLRQRALDIEENPCHPSGSNCDVSTNSAFLESIRRHIRVPRELQKKQSVPLTSAQEIGWEKQDLQPPVAGREGSHITKFAAELVKNGIYY